MPHLNKVPPHKVGRNAAYLMAEFALSLPHGSIYKELSSNNLRTIFRRLLVHRDEQREKSKAKRKEGLDAMREKQRMQRMLLRQARTIDKLRKELSIYGK